MPTSARLNRRQVLADVGIRAPILFGTAMLAFIHPANAHPGHPLLDHGASHLMTSPYHWAMLGATGVAMIAIAKVVRNRSARQCLGIAGIGAVIAAGLLCALGY